CILLHLSPLYAQQGSAHQRPPAGRAATGAPEDSLRLLYDQRSRFSHLKGEPPARGLKRLVPLPGKGRMQAMRAPAPKVLGEAAVPFAHSCYAVSGRNFLRQDSLVLYSGDPTFTADGNVIVPGEFADFSKDPFVAGGFCMKTDTRGNVIWAKLYDSSVHRAFDYMIYFKAVELRNGSILLAGRTTNNLSKNDDLVLTLLDKNGNILWLKTYESKFWQGFNGSGDHFVLHGLEEDPAGGALYFAGHHWTGKSTVTRIDPADGRIVWSNAYDTWGDNDQVFGLQVNAGNLQLFQLDGGSYNESYLSVMTLNKANGDTIYRKHLQLAAENSYSPRLFRTYEVVRQHNGHILLSGATTGDRPNALTGPDLHHAGVIELDEQLNFVRGFGFKNRVPGNYYNTKVSLFPDGSGVFTFMNYVSGYTADSRVVLFRNGQIYHQRKRVHANEGIPYEPLTLRMPDGGFLNVKG
ncbi:hypothetical protein V9K67_26990, partial [Paraflavisolibacter sp. H34]|uniref:hypothetical protein n=1 Tax=Huijunlia imazamoxiresistens TaxID=3127457 RepID=UPI0030163D94